MHNYYKSGSWNAICDVCGFKFKNDELKKRWDGLMVCSRDYELDHPQKYLRVHETGQAVPWVREEPESNFLYVCYLWGASAYADIAEADCARADNTVFTYGYLLSLLGESLGPDADFDELFLGDEDQLYLFDDELGI